MKKHVFIALAFLSILGCTNSKKDAPDDAFVLKGSVENIPEGKWIYLIHNKKALDSTQIANNSFEFKGKLEQPKEFRLYAKNARRAASVWLEPGEIVFQAKDSTLSNPEITGSTTQKEDDILTQRQEPYRKLRDSLTRAFLNPKATAEQKAVAREALGKVYEDHLKIEQAFIKDYPDSYVSVWLIDFYATTMGSKKTQELYDLLSEEVKVSEKGKSVQNFLNLSKNPKVGDRYTDFALANEKGESVQVSDFDGKVILLDFWASWCGPCIKEYPALKNAYATYQDQGFEIVSISEDQSKDRWLQAIEKNNLNWVNLWDPQGNKADPYLIYGISGIPDNFLINKEGIIVARNLRGENLIQEIQKHINGKGMP